MTKLLNYLKLMRFHKPVGILLLWFPTAWALWLANKGNPPLRLILLFFIGTVLMRAAGCIINDIADRNIDLHVKRTEKRPLTAGDVNLFEAFGLLFGLLILALLILIQLPKACFLWAIFAVFITFLYPFCKRFIDAPQAVLGIAFSLGIPMAYVASNKDLSPLVGLLMFINFLWSISYDTQYALVDKEDDLRIGVKSTAILFGKHIKLILALIALSLHLLWLYIGYSQKLGVYFFFSWFIAGFVLIYQQWLIAHLKETDCFRAFLSNSWYGALMWFALMLG